MRDNVDKREEDREPALLPDEVGDVHCEVLLTPFLPREDISG